MHVHAFASTISSVTHPGKNLWCHSYSGVVGGGGLSNPVNYELVYVNQCKVEQLRISVLSGRKRVRGCGWVMLCGRGAASADMTAKWKK